jgi:hypothetical protein
MKFTVIPADNYIWNIADLNKFLIDNQGQDIEISTKDEGCCCRSIGLYDLLDQFKFNSVVIHTNNPLEKHNKYSIQIVSPWQFLKVRQEIEPEFHTWDKTQIFGTLYGRPTWHRIGIAAHLLTYHSQLSLVGCLCDPTNIDNREFVETNELYKNDLASFKNFGNIINQLPLQLPAVTTYVPGIYEPGGSVLFYPGKSATDRQVEQTKQPYKNFFIDIVAETFTSGDCFYITEKTVRPMVLKKPFIIMGSKDYLCYLRQLGFKTFQTPNLDFWSEDYDGYEGRDRYVRILALIDELAKKSKEELQDMYQAMQPILDHNYNLLQTQSYNKTITKII